MIKIDKYKTLFLNKKWHVGWVLYHKYDCIGIHYYHYNTYYEFELYIFRFKFYITFIK